MRLSLPLSLLLASAAQADDADSHLRVFIADHAAPRITALDLDAPDRRWTFDTVGQARLYSLAGGEVIAAVQSDDDIVQFIDSGIALHDHGDHADLSVDDPIALEGVLAGPRPFHVVSHDGAVAVNFDLGGYNLILSDAALAEGRVETATFPQNRAHHGFAAPMGGAILSTVASNAPVAGDAAPERLGLRAFDADGAPLGDLAACTAIHGEAFSGAYLAAGCAEGVIVATAQGGTFAYEMLPYPADFPEGTTGTLHGGRSVQLFLGNHGADGLVVIDPTGAAPMQRIALPFRRVDFLLDPVRPDTGWALTEDGSLHRIDVLAAAVVGSAPVTGTYSMDGDWNDPRPRLAVAGDHVLVTDPAAGALHVVAVDTLAPVETIAVGGLPYTLAVAGGSGLAH